MSHREETDSCVLEVKVRADLLMEFAYASRAIVEAIETDTSWKVIDTRRAEALCDRWHKANHALCRGLEIAHDA